MSYSENQNSCLFAAFVQGVCHYGGPVFLACHGYGPESNLFQGVYCRSTGSWQLLRWSNADDVHACECNSATYTLASACAAFLRRLLVFQLLVGLRWAWNTLVCGVSLSHTSFRYPESIPDGTAMPHWAYQDAASSGLDVTLAQAVGEKPRPVAATAPASTAFVTRLPISAGAPPANAGNCQMATWQLCICQVH